MKSKRLVTMQVLVMGSALLCLCTLASETTKEQAAPTVPVSRPFKKADPFYQSMLIKIENALREGKQALQYMLAIKQAFGLEGLKNLETDLQPMSGKEAVKIFLVHLNKQIETLETSTQQRAEKKLKEEKAKEKLPAPQVTPSGPAAIPTTLPLKEIKLEKIKEISHFINWCLAPDRAILDKEKIASEIKRLSQMEKIEDTLMVLLDAKESTLDPLRARFQPKKLTPEEKKLKPEQLKSKLEAKKSAQEINFEIINKVINTFIKGIQEELKGRLRVTKKVRRLPEEARKTLKPELSSQLFEAIKKGDAKSVTDLIAAGVDINKPDPATEQTPLVKAITDGLEDIARILVANGADVNQSDTMFRTPILWAVFSGNYNLVKLLIEKDAKLSCGVLDNAIEKGDEKLVELLINSGVDLFSGRHVLNFVLNPSTTSTHFKNISIILAAQKKAPIPPKSCYVTFTQKDHNDAIVRSIAFALACKIPVISSGPMLDRLITKYPNLENYLRNNEWSLFYNARGTLGVIIPSPIHGDDLQRDFGLINLNPISPDQAVAAIKKGLGSPVVKLINDFGNIIDRSSLQHPTRFYLDGHGKYQDPTYVGIIANMYLDEMQKFIETLIGIGAEFLYINSCYTAGLNLLKLQNNIQTIINNIMLEQNKIIIQQKGKLTKALPFQQLPIIAVQATSGVKTGGIGYLHIFFTKLDEYLRPTTTKKGKRPSMDSVIKSLCLLDVYNLPSVRFSGTNTFFRAADLGNMEIITWALLRSFRFENTFKLAQLKARLKFLEQPKEKPEEEIKRINDEIKKSEITIDIGPEIKYVEIFPVNLVDCHL